MQKTSLLSAHDIRQKFIEFFERNGHKHIASSSLVPAGDPTLLFTNAGMNQFKSVFTGQETRSYTRAVTSQKCVRAGGKHNDLENVGYTARHHTFFEMLGNFSFGDYFKKEAIEYAWTFITNELKVPKSRLYVTVFETDDEAFNLWNKHIGIEASRIYRFGTKDNFWSMGDTGPCGPCSEIFYDQGTEVGCKKSTCQVGCDCDRFMEIWNLVFMEFEQRQDGTRIKLPKPSIDTGMGLERVTTVLQNVHTNYDTDLFLPILKKLSELSGVAYETCPEHLKGSMRAIADHARATTFLISDGVLPSKEGRGYVLRRIMRRAIRHASKLGLHELFLGKLCSVVIEEMAKSYPELLKNKGQIESAVLQEERQFSKTLTKGLELLEIELKKLKATNKSQLPGDIAFHLYDTYGFPIDLTQDILREQGMALDQTGYDEAFESHREKARGSWKGSQVSHLADLVSAWTQQGVSTKFLGYENLTAEAEILKLVVHGQEVEKVSAGESCELIADQTPFYGEGGGQVGDIGTITHAKGSIEVVNTQKPSPSLFVHHCHVLEGEISVGDLAVFTVDAKARAATAKNHSATHLLHATLANILGGHVTQKGSLVAPEKLRFDFTHTKALSDAELLHIEQTMNDVIWKDFPVKVDLMPIEAAVASGAKALFDEKYGENVRVVSMGDYSKELCGGTHLARTGDIGMFKIIKESSVAAGVRRIEAYTSQRALRYVQDQEAKLKKMSTALGVPVEAMVERVEQILTAQKDAKKKSSEVLPTKEPVVETVAGTALVILEISDPEQKDIRGLTDRLQEKYPNSINVVFNSAVLDNVVGAIKVSESLVKQHSAQVFLGDLKNTFKVNGGGKPNMVQFSGLKHADLPASLDLIKNKIKS